jgi:4-carboxymuconolactone decarboxylase
MTLVHQPRIASVTSEAMTEAQRSVAAVVAAGPRGGVRGPFAVLLHSPQAFDAAQRLGAYLRFESALRADLRELAVLVTARFWKQPYEWRAHAPLAEQAGVDPLAIDALAHGREPATLSADQALVWRFCAQLHAKTKVDDAVFAAVQALIGEAGVIDLCVVCGYYAMLAMVINVAQNPPGDGALPFEQEP